MKRGDEIEVTLENAAFEGKNIARVDGMVVFVRGAAPGDVARIRLASVKKNYAEADAIAVLVPSPLRAEPRCPHFGVCGGCAWQHLSYDAQLRFKRQHVVDALERIGGFRDVCVNETLGAGNPYHYRNKMEFSFGERWLSAEEMAGETSGRTVDRFALGLHIPGRFDRVLDLETCFLPSPASAGILGAVRTFARARKLTIYSTRSHTGYLRNLVVRESIRTGGLMVNLVTSDDRPDIMADFTRELLAEFPSITTVVNNITERTSQVAIGEREQVYHGPGWITERIGRRTYRISANSFFQTNTEQAERLYDTVLRMTKAAPRDLLFDLYCGTGTIALHVADNVRRVIGIEAVPSAIEDAERNAAANGAANCRFLLGDLKEKLTADTEWLADAGTPDIVITDPPRAGMHEKVAKQILDLAPRRIVYVSCNPSTQARDLKILCATGMYAIEEVQPVDMFPHTYHIENVAAVRKR